MTSVGGDELSHEQVVCTFLKLPRLLQLAVLAAAWHLGAAHLNRLGDRQLSRASHIRA